MEDKSDNLDLSNKKLKKVVKICPPQDAPTITTLILDDNELQRLENIDCFVNLQKLSVVRNQLLRMYGVCRLHSLHTLNLAHNGILTIEGLKDLTNLKWLCLAGNSIKTIEHLNTNVALEYLDLSQNNITYIADLSFLKNLKELFLHRNKINHLRQCDRFLPVSLTTLTLANNNIEDLNELSQLAHLVDLASVSIANNPCVNMTSVGFDYRPFVINWCLNVKTIDGYVVDAIESLRAEWLYSQGRGRHFRVGDQQQLVQYLASVCPLTGEALETEEDRKLRLILSKAQHHQQQLREQSESPAPSPLSKKKQGPRNSPRVQSAKLHGKQHRSPDRMTSSLYHNPQLSDSANVMTQSLDPSMLRQTTKPPLDSNAEPINSPLQALSKMVPVPETLMSPDCKPPPSILNRHHQPTLPKSASSSPKPARHMKTRIPENKSLTPSPQRARKNYSAPAATRSEIPNNVNNKSSMKKAASDDDELDLCNAKLEQIQLKAEEKQKQKESDERVNQAAISIQKMWRGYYTRNKNKEVQEVFRTLQAQRAGEYIEKLTTDMETTKAALESERKIQMLQTEAINALWKQMSNLQSGQDSVSEVKDSNGDVVKELAKTCNLLQNQIQHLQSSMQEIIKVMTNFSHTKELNNLVDKGIATQTEIVAVHTPQGDAGKVFPYVKQTRPSSLPLQTSQNKEATINSELQQYADTVADGVLRKVSESSSTDGVGDSNAETTSEQDLI